ncbi:MAG TPA: choice-of-anchor D domain-containing protein [Polyangia bacterium]
MRVAVGLFLGALVLGGVGGCDSGKAPAVDASLADGAAATDGGDAAPAADGGGDAGGDAATPADGGDAATPADGGDAATPADAAPAAHLTFAEAPAFDYGTLATGRSVTHVFRLTNDGGQTATALAGTPLAAPFAFAGGAYPGLGGSCGTTLDPGATCAIVVAFTPADPVAAAGTLSVGYHDGAAAQTASCGLAGAGTHQGHLVVTDFPLAYYTDYGLPPDPAAYDFGRVGLGTTATHAFHVANVGLAPATSLLAGPLAAPYGYAGGAFPGAGGTCGATLAPRDACIVMVGFAPAAAPRATAELSLAYSDGAALRVTSRPLTGAGATGAVLTITDFDVTSFGPAWDFGTLGVGVTGMHTFYVANSGGGPATAVTAAAIGPGFAYAGGAYPGAGGTCGAAIAAGTQCQLVVAFTPVAAGPATGAVALDYDDGAAAQTATRPVRGTGTGLALVVIQDQPDESGPPLFDYGTLPLGAAAEHTFTVVNAGAQAASALQAAALAAPFAYKDGAYPGTGGDCGAALGAGATCTLVVTFHPTTAGHAGAAITLGYHDGSVARTATRTVIGAGTDRALLAISDDAHGGTPDHPYDFGTAGQPVAHAFTVTNAGASAVTALTGAVGAPFRFKGGAFPGAGGDCDALPLAPGARCTIVVELAPAGGGLAASQIDLTYDDGVGAQHARRDVTGTGTSRAFLLITDCEGCATIPAVVSFGTAGAPVSRTVSVTNTGARDITALGAGSPALGDGFGFTGGAYPGGGTCGATLAAGARCTVALTFTPPSDDAAHASTLALAFDDGLGTQTATRGLSAVATTAPLVTIDDFAGGGRSGSVFDFGPAGVPASWTFWVRNQGATDVTDLGAGTTLGDGFEWAGAGYPGGGTCGASLAKNASCTVLVTFTPPAQPGTHASTLTLTYGAGRTATRGLTATAAALAQLSFYDGTAFDYGTIATGHSLNHLFAVMNTGGRPATALTLGALAAPFGFAGGRPYPGFGGSCGATLDPGAICTLAVAFTPAGPAPATGTLTLGYHDGAAAQSATCGVSGAGTDQARLVVTDFPLEYYTAFGLPADPATHDFGRVGLGATATYTFYLTNVGLVAATALHPAALAAPFSAAGGSCGATLAPGEACSVVVAFTPTAAPSATATLSLDYDDGAQTRTVSRAVAGAGASGAVLTVTDFDIANIGPVWDFGTFGLGASVSHGFYVTNHGAAAATAITTPAIGAGFGYEGGAYPGTNGTCGSTIPAGTRCQVVIAFAPTLPGPATGAVALGYFDGTATQSARRDVRGTGTKRALLVIQNKEGDSGPPVFDYGTRPLGSTTEHAFTVVNAGADQATAMGGRALAAPFAYKDGTYPGTGGDCGATLLAGHSCTVVVTFHPTATAPAGATLALDYDDGGAARTATRTVVGAGTDRALLVITDWPDSGPSDHPYDFGTAGMPVGHTFTVTNAGARAVTTLTGALAPPFRFTGGTFPGTGGDCTTLPLAPGARCSLAVEFAPAAGGAVTGQIDLTYDDGLGAQHARRDLAGTGTTRALLLVTECDGCGPGQQPIDFGTAGAPVWRRLTLVNAGARDITTLGPGSPALGDGFGFQGGGWPGGGDCGTTLAKGARCWIGVAFTPPADNSAHASTLALSYDDGLGAQTATRGLTAHATTAAVLELGDYPDGGRNGDRFDYGTVGAAATHVFTLANRGGGPATGLGDGGGLGDGFAYTGGSFPAATTCGATLAAGASCTVSVTFTPSGDGAHASTLTLAFSGGTVTRGLAATATSKALLVISDWDGGGGGNGMSAAPFDYGTAGIALSHTFTVRNVGARTATGLAPDVAQLGGAFGLTGLLPMGGGTCGASLPAGESCTVSVSFLPSSDGLRGGTLALTYQDGTATRGLTGTATSAPRLVISDGPEPPGGPGAGPMSFGTTGVPVTRTAWVINVGGAGATGIAAAALGDGFAFQGGSYAQSGTCTASLARGASCSASVTFTPPADDARHGSTLTLDYDGGRHATRALTAVATTAPLVVVSENRDWAPAANSPPYDFGITGRPVTRGFYARNLGGAGATGIAAAPLGDGFAFGGGSLAASGTCGATLATGASCQISVTFTPGTAGPHASAIDLAYDGGRHAVRALSATATDGAYLTVSEWSGGASGQNPPPFDLGTWGVATTRTFHVTNGGRTGATVTAGTVDGGTGFAWVNGSYVAAGTCGATIAAGATCQVNVAFTPTGDGARASTITLAYTDAGGGHGASRAVTATATTRAFVQILDWDGSGPPMSPFDYGTWGHATPHTFTVTNQGAQDASLTPAAFATADFRYAGGGDCGAALAHGASCTVVVELVPAGDRVVTGTFALDYADAGGGRTAARDLRGTATTRPYLVLADFGPGCGEGCGPYAFGVITAGSSTDHVFGLTNQGAVPTTAIAADLTGPFFLTGGYPGTGGDCGAALAPGAWCNVGVTFATTAYGPASGLLKVRYTEGLTPELDLTRSLVGTAQ